MRVCKLQTIIIIIIIWSRHIVGVNLCILSFNWKEIFFILSELQCVTCSTTMAPEMDEIQTHRFSWYYQGREASSATALLEHRILILPSRGH